VAVGQPPNFFDTLWEARAPETAGYSGDKQKKLPAGAMVKKKVPAKVAGHCWVASWERNQGFHPGVTRSAACDINQSIPKEPGVHSFFLTEKPMQDRNFLHIRFASSLTSGDPALDTVRDRPVVSRPLRPARPFHSLSPEAGSFLDWLFRQGGVDRSLYRDPPIARRLGACLRALRVGTPSEARELLTSNPQLQAVALDSILIGVSEFFRDAAVFSRLRSRDIPALLQSPGPIRIWSVGCSDGSELYSVAFILAGLGALQRAEFFGTDCRASAVERARLGIFGAQAVQELLPEWTPWLTREKHGCVVAGQIRQKVRFEQGDVFSELLPGDFHMILCRNLAIYLRPHAVQELWRRLASRLRPEGLLVTGKSERGDETVLTRIGPSLYRRKGGSGHEE
jgi:chemotaxis protein methyltransferase CheR